MNILNLKREEVKKIYKKGGDLKYGKVIAGY